MWRPRIQGPRFEATAGGINKYVKQQSLKGMPNNILKQPQCHIYVVGIHFQGLEMAFCMLSKELTQTVYSGHYERNNTTLWKNMFKCHFL